MKHYSIPFLENQELSSLYYIGNQLYCNAAMGMMDDNETLIADRLCYPHSNGNRSKLGFQNKAYEVLRKLEYHKRGLKDMMI